MPIRAPERPSAPPASSHEPEVVTDALAPVPPVQPLKPVRPFRATKLQRLYLEAWLDPQAPKSVVGIAKSIGISPWSVYHWRENPAYVAWFDAELERQTDSLWKPVLQKITQLALAGSVEHAKLLAQIRGAIKGDGSERGGGGVTVIVGVPRAGDRVELPAPAPGPTLLLPVPSVEQH